MLKAHYPSRTLQITTYYNIILQLHEFELISLNKLKIKEGDKIVITSDILKLLIKSRAKKLNLIRMNLLT